mgnify:FL=1
MAEQIVRKSLYFSEDLWESFEDFRFDNRIKSEAEGLRILLQAGIYLCKLREDPVFVQAEEAAVERLNNQG